MDELPMDLDFLLGHSRDGSGFVQIASDPGAIPDWSVTLHYADNEERSLRVLHRELELLVGEIQRYLDGDRGGPTPETLAHADQLVRCHLPGHGFQPVPHDWNDGLTAVVCRGGAE